MRSATTDTAHTTLCSGGNCAYLLTFNSLWWGAWRNFSTSTATLLGYVNNCKKPSRKHKHSPHLRLRDRSDTMTRRLMPFHWRQMTLSWLKLTPTGGRGKWRTGGRRTVWSGIPSCWRSPLVPHEKPGQDAHKSSSETDFFSLLLQRELPFVWLCKVSGPSAHHCPRGTTSGEEWDWGCTTKCKLSTASPVTNSSDSSMLGEQEALSYPSDIFWSVPVESKVKSSM